MNSKIPAIFQRELHSYFASPMAYIFVMIFQIICGLFFWIQVSDTRLASLRNTLIVIRSVLLFVTPMLTMRLVAEERKSGTLELLFTSPVKSLELVLGKFLAALALYVLMFALTLPYPIILAALGEPEFSPLVTGYLGLFLIAACYTSVGIFASSLTPNQLIAGIIAFGILLGFLILEWLTTLIHNPFFAGLFRHFSFFEHGESLDKGVLATPDLLYFLLFAFIFLFLTVRALEFQRDHSAL